MMNDTHPDIPPEPSRKVRLLLFLLSPKVAFPLMILLALLSAPFMYRTRQILKLPDIGDPFDVQTFGTVEMTDEENAYVEYIAAGKLLVELKGTAKILDEQGVAIDEGWSAASEDIRKWVVANRPALELWRKGTEKPDALYHQPKDIDIATLLPVVENLREFSRLVVIEGSRLEEAGELDEAWNWYRALYRSSRHSGLHGTLIERLVGVAIQAIAANAIEEWSRNPQVTADQLKRAIEQLKSDYTMTAPTSVAFKTEYLGLTNTLSPEAIAKYSETGSGYPLPTGNIGLFLMGEPDLTVRIMQHSWANWIEQIDKPLSQRTQLAPGLLRLFTPDPTVTRNPQPISPDEIQEAFLSSFLARTFLPAISQADRAILREQLRHRALLVVLAAQWYKREHGEFPEKIEDLLDGYLDTIPLDPHDAKGGNLKYRRNPDGFTVWGIGENGTDDGGRIGWRPDHDDFGYHIGEKEEKTEKN